MSIKTIENQLVNVLNAAKDLEGEVLAPMLIEACPEDFERRDLLSSVGSVWVHFSGKNSQDPEGFSTVQEQSYSFDVHVFTRNLRPGYHATKGDEDGNAYDVMDTIESVLSGYVAATGLKPMYHKESKLVQSRDGVWQYGMRFITKGMFFKPATDTVLGISTKITFESTGRTFTIPPTEE